LKYSEFCFDSAPAVPDGLVANALVTVDVGWNFVAGADTYELARTEKMGNGNNWGLVTLLTNTQGTAYEDATVVAGNSYRYYVRAQNAGGRSDWSAAVQVKVSGVGGGSVSCKGNKKNCSGS
jgi:hypothetical protein